MISGQPESQAVRAADGWPVRSCATGARGGIVFRFYVIIIATIIIMIVNNHITTIIIIVIRFVLSPCFLGVS